MSMSRRKVIQGSIAVAGMSAIGATRAVAGNPAIKLGVLSDMSGPISHLTGIGSVVATRLAVEDFKKAYNPPFEIEVISADHQNKPDIGSGLARYWCDQEGVDCIVDVGNSAVALAVANIVRSKDKVAAFSAGSAALTNEACSPNHTCWTYDTWALSHGTAQELLSEGADSWYFLTPNYAFGKSLYEEASKVVLANKGKVLGNSVYPFPETSDFSSFLLQAQASKAKILAMAGGNTDASNMLKQAAEFQIGAPGSGQLIAALIFLILDVHAAGLEISQGLNLMESFYWDMNDGTRALTKRYAAHMSGSVPCMMQAGMYSGVLHYLKTAHAMGVDKAKASGRAVVNQMIAMPTQDIVYAKGALRRDGRHIHDMYIFQVKTPAESKYPWDYFKLVKTIPAEKAFRPLSEGTCNLVKT